MLWPPQRPGCTIHSTQPLLEARMGEGGEVESLHGFKYPRHTTTRPAFYLPAGYSHHLKHWLTESKQTLSKGRQKILFKETVTRDFLYLFLYKSDLLYLRVGSWHPKTVFALKLACEKCLRNRWPRRQRVCAINTHFHFIVYITSNIDALISDSL